MLAVLVASLAVTQGAVLKYDDGNNAGPNDYSSLSAHAAIKELVRFQAPRRMRLSAVHFMPEGKPGTFELHFWKDIDAQIPFRHFEFEAVKPVVVKVDVRNLGKWKKLEIAPFVLEKGQRIFVGHVGRGLSFACDSRLNRPDSSLVEAFETNAPGKYESKLLAPAGDFLVRLEGNPIEEDTSVRFKSFFEAKAPARALAWGDVDGDGYEDLLVDGRLLLKNDKGKRFRRAQPFPNGSADFGVFADFDNDGDQDLFQGTGANASPDRLLANNGKGVFSTAQKGLPKESLYGVSACWFDFDRDGRLDLFVANGARLGDLGSSDPSRLYRNSKNGLVPIATDLMAGGKKAAFGSAVAAGDLDANGLPELFVGTYRLEPDQLWSFESSPPRNVASDFQIDRMISPSGRPGGGHCLGCRMADVDNDGDLDLIVANLIHPDWRGFLGSNESLYFENLGKMRFRRRKLRELGIDFEETPANPVLEDFDNDGLLDLFHNSMYHTANLYVWRNGKWVDRTSSSRVVARRSVAAAACDFDHDGRIDLAVGDEKRGVIVYRNVSPMKAWLALKLIGRHCNRDAAGATVRLRAGKQTITRQVSLGHGMACQDSAILHFGLGDSKARLSGDILWPCGRHQSLNPLASNKLIGVAELKNPR